MKNSTNIILGGVGGQGVLVIQLDHAPRVAGAHRPHAEVEHVAARSRPGGVAFLGFPEQVLVELLVLLRDPRPFRRQQGGVVTVGHRLHQQPLSLAARRFRGRVAVLGREQGEAAGKAVEDQPAHLGHGGVLLDGIAAAEHGGHVLGVPAPARIPRMG